MMFVVISMLARAAAPVAVPGTTLTIAADVTAEHPAGYSILVPVRVQNTGDAPATFPDLGARPWLVHFATVSPEGKEADRFTTPPAADPGTVWTIPPRATRAVLMEIPSSQGFAAGDWNITLSVTSPAIEIGKRQVAIAAPNPVAGTPTWEPTVATAVGASLPWVHQGRRGAALFLMQWAGGGKFEGLYPMAALEKVVDPVLSIARAPDARTRWTYWSAGRALQRVRLQGTEISPVQEVSLPTKDAELLGRGVTAPDGTLMVPLWIPSPSGKGGSVRLLVVDERDGVSARVMTDLPMKPSVVKSAVDASGGLLLLLGHADGLDLYRAQPTDPSALPVKGVRVVKTIQWMSTVAASFVNVPDSAERAGGLAIFGLVRGTAADGREWVTKVLADVNGVIFDRAPETSWTMRAPVADVLATGYGGWGVVGRDEAGVWYATEGAAPVKVDAPVQGPMAIFGGINTRLRWLAGPKVYAEAPLGPAIVEPAAAASN